MIIRASVIRVSTRTGGPAFPRPSQVFLLRVDFMHGGVCYYKTVPFLILMELNHSKDHLCTFHLRLLLPLTAHNRPDTALLLRLSRAPVLSHDSRCINLWGPSIFNYSGR